SNRLTFKGKKSVGCILANVALEDGSILWHRTFEADVYIECDAIKTTVQGGIAASLVYGGELHIDGNLRDTSPRERRRGYVAIWDSKGKQMWNHTILADSGSFAPVDLLSVNNEIFVVHATTSSNVRIGTQTAQGETKLVNVLLGFSHQGQWIWTKYYGSKRIPHVQYLALQPFDKQTFLVHNKNTGEMWFDRSTMNVSNKHRASLTWLLHVDAKQGRLLDVHSRNFALSYRKLPHIQAESFKPSMTVPMVSLTVGQHYTHDFNFYGRNVNMYNKPSFLLIRDFWF
ncbi:MAG: hypothetical protein AAGJ35_13670, partial [Myxococcota bacterium]